jgi:protein SCO1/2
MRANASAQGRRRVLLALAAAAFAGGRVQAAAPPPPLPQHDHFPFGPLGKPRRIGAFKVLDSSGRPGDLAGLLRGKTTALQLMFAGCRASCPIQGAVFARAQRLAQRQGLAVQFLSLSIDALGDSPERLQAWLRQFDAQPGWLAAVPVSVADVDAISTLLGAGGQGVMSGSDAHNGQVHLVNRHGDLVERTPVTPPAADIVSAMQRLQQRFG